MNKPKRILASILALPLATSIIPATKAYALPPSGMHPLNDTLTVTRSINVLSRNVHAIWAYIDEDKNPCFDHTVDSLGSYCDFLQDVGPSTAPDRIAVCLVNLYNTLIRVYKFFYGPNKGAVEALNAPLFRNGQSDLDNILKEFGLRYGSLFSDENTYRQVNAGTYFIRNWDFQPMNDVLLKAALETSARLVKNFKSEVPPEFLVETLDQFDKPAKELTASCQIASSYTLEPSMEDRQKTLNALDNLIIAINNFLEIKGLSLYQTGPGREIAALLLALRQDLETVNYNDQASLLKIIATGCSLAELTNKISPESNPILYNLCKNPGLDILREEYFTPGIGWNYLKNTGTTSNCLETDRKNVTFLTYQLANFQVPTISDEQIFEQRELIEADFRTMVAKGANKIKEAKDAIAWYKFGANKKELEKLQMALERLYRSLNSNIYTCSYGKNETSATFNINRLKERVNDIKNAAIALNEKSTNQKNQVFPIDIDKLDGDPKVALYYIAEAFRKLS